MVFIDNSGQKIEKIQCSGCGNMLLYHCTDVQFEEKVDMINKDGSKHTASYKQFIVCPACTRQIILDSGIIVYKKEI